MRFPFRRRYLIRLACCIACLAPALHSAQSPRTLVTPEGEVLPVRAEKTIRVSAENRTIRFNLLPAPAILPAAKSALSVEPTTPPPLTPEQQALRDDLASGRIVERAHSLSVTAHDDRHAEIRWWPEPGAPARLVLCNGDLRWLPYSLSLRIDETYHTISTVVFPGSSEEPYPPSIASAAPFAYRLADDTAAPLTDDEATALDVLLSHYALHIADLRAQHEAAAAAARIEAQRRRVEMSRRKFSEVAFWPVKTRLNR